MLRHFETVHAPPEQITAPAAPAEVLAERFRGYLLAERGLQPNVASGYVACVRPFIASSLRGDGQPGGLAQLTVAEVTGFMTGQARRLEPKSAQMLATALRPPLRFELLNELMTATPVEQLSGVSLKPEDRMSRTVRARRLANVNDTASAGSLGL